MIKSIMRFFEIKEKIPLNFIVSGQLKSKNGFLHMKRIINENVMIFVQEGTLYMNSNNKNYTISKNQFIFLKAGEEHFGYKKSSGFLSYYWVHFSDLVQISKNGFSEPLDCSYKFPETGTIENPTRLLMLFKQLIDFSLDNSFYNKQVLNYSLSIILMEFTQNCLNLEGKKSAKLNPLINDIFNWIKLNFQKDFSIYDLAASLNLQSSYISKQFKKYTGKSIVQYTTEIRLTAAKNLLQSFSVKETAYSCGFDDEKYFMKVFKKYEGVTPTQYKQAFSLNNINQ